MKKIKYTVRIKRYNPDEDRSYYQDFEVEVEDTLTVLEYFKTLNLKHLNY